QLQKTVESTGSGRRLSAGRNGVPGSGSVALGGLRRVRERGNGTSKNLDLDIVRDLKNDESALLVQGRDAPENASARHDFVAFLQLAQHVLGSLLPFSHRRKHQEIEDREDEDHRRELEERVRRRAGGGGLQQGNHGRRIISSFRRALSQM